MNKTDHSIPTDKTTVKQYRSRLPLLPLACILLILLVFSGCAQKNRGLQPAEPPLVLPEAFTQSGSQSPEPYSWHEYWWHEFGDDNLRHLIDTALEGNPNLKIYGERLIQAQALARKAGSDLLPSLNGQAAAAKSRAHNDQGTATSTDLLLGLAASYEIDLWGRLQAVEDASLLDARASADDLQAASLSLAAQVANLWYQLAESYDQEAVLKQQQEVNQTALELVRLRFNAGQIGIADLLQQKQLIESKNGELARQRATSKVLEHQLSILAGIAPGTFTLPAKPDLIALPPLPATGVPADLLANRPDIRS
ncbi:MAG TPA: TolC family protein, partial [Desulfopila sp.]|nr:TolC family protein [Desulfopila sp.]